MRKNPPNSTTSPPRTPSSVARRSGRVSKPLEEGESVTSGSASVVDSKKVGAHSMAGTSSAGPPKQPNGTTKTESSSNPTPWKHPAELPYICRDDWSQDLMILYLCKKSFTIPPRDSNTALPFFQVTPRNSAPIDIPRKYRIPLLFLSKFQWDSLRLVLNSANPAKEWQDYRFDIIHISRLCQHFFDQAKEAKEKAGSKGALKTWRSRMFDRVLTRFYHHWFISQDWSIKHFYEEFDEEEYDNDVLKYDWSRWALKGHKGFQLTKQEIQNGLAAEQYTKGLVRSEKGEWSWVIPPEVQPVVDSNTVNLDSQSTASSQQPEISANHTNPTPAHNTIEVKHEHLALNGVSNLNSTGTPALGTQDPSQAAPTNAIDPVTRPIVVSIPDGANVLSTITNPLPRPSSPSAGTKRPREENESISAQPKKRRTKLTARKKAPAQRPKVQDPSATVQTAPVAPIRKIGELAVGTVPARGPTPLRSQLLPFTFTAPEKRTVATADSISAPVNQNARNGTSSSSQTVALSPSTLPTAISRVWTSPLTDLNPMSPSSLSSPRSQKSASPTPLTTSIASAIAVPTPALENHLPPPVTSKGLTEAEEPTVQENVPSSTFTEIVAPTTTSVPTQTTQLPKDPTNQDSTTAAVVRLMPSAESETPASPIANAQTGKAQEVAPTSQPQQLERVSKPMPEASPSSAEDGLTPKQTISEVEQPQHVVSAASDATVARPPMFTDNTAIRTKSMLPSSLTPASGSEVNPVVEQLPATSSGISPMDIRLDSQSSFDSVFPGLSVKPRSIESATSIALSGHQKDAIRDDMDVEDQSGCPPIHQPNGVLPFYHHSVELPAPENTRTKSLHTILLLRELLDFLRAPSAKPDNPRSSVQDERRERPSVFDGRTRHMVLEGKTAMTIDQRLEILTYSSVGLAKLLLALRGEALETRVDTLDKRLQQEFNVVWNSEGYSPRELEQHTRVLEEKEVQTSIPAVTSFGIQTTAEEPIPTIVPEVTSQGIQTSVEPEKKLTDDSGVQTDDIQDPQPAPFQIPATQSLSPDATMIDLSQPQISDVALLSPPKFEIDTYDKDPPVTKLMMSIMRNMADLFDCSIQKDPPTAKSLKGKEREMDVEMQPPNAFMDSPIVTAIMHEFKTMKNDLRQTQQWSREEIQLIHTRHRAEVESLKLELAKTEQKDKELEELRRRHHEEVERLRNSIQLMEKDREKEKDSRDATVIPALELLELRRRISSLEALRYPSGSVAEASTATSQSFPVPISRLEIPHHRQLHSHPLGHLITQDYEDGSSVSSPRTHPYGREASLSKPGTPMPSDRQSFAARHSDSMDLDEMSMPLPIKTQRKAYMMAFPRPHVG